MAPLDHLLRYALWDDSLISFTDSCFAGGMIKHLGAALGGAVQGGADGLAPGQQHKLRQCGDEGLLHLLRQVVLRLLHACHCQHLPLPYLWHVTEGAGLRRFMYSNVVENTSIALL